MQGKTGRCLAPISISWCLAPIFALLVCATEKGFQMCPDNNLIYHYTTKENLEKILCDKDENGKKKNRELHLSSCAAYTDSKPETGALRQALEAGFKNEKFEKSIRNFVKKKMKLSISEPKDLIEAVVKMRADSYICCFSADNNNNYLWEKHAKKGEGVAIGIRKEYIPDATATTTKNKKRVSEARFIEMKYGEQAFIDTITGLAEISWATLVFAIDSYKACEHKKEQEVRLCVFLPNTNDLRKLHLDKKDGENGRITRLFKYSEKQLRFELESSYLGSTASDECTMDNILAIKNIYSRNKETKKSVENLLKQHNLDKKIKVSFLTK